MGSVFVFVFLSFGITFVSSERRKMGEMKALNPGLAVAMVIRLVEQPPLAMV